MSSSQARVLRWVLLAIFCWRPGPASAEPPQEVRMQLAGRENVRRADGRDDIRYRHGYGNCQWLYPHRQCQEQLSEQPEFASENAVFYLARFGDGDDSDYTLVIDESGGTDAGYDTLYVDSNNDNRLDARSERLEYRPGTSSDTAIRICLMVTAGGRTSAYYVDFSAFLYRNQHDPVRQYHANLRDSSFYVGEATFAGRRHAFAILDLNSNGLFNDYEPGRVFRGDRLAVDRNGDGVFSARDEPELNESFPYSRFLHIGGFWYRLEVSPDGSQARLETATPRLGAVTAPAGVTRVVLTAPDQSLDLRFSEGREQAVAGSFKVANLQITTEAGRLNDWTLSASLGNAPPELTIEAGKITRLPLGPPLKVEPELRPNANGNVVQVRLRISGSGGESYGPQGFLREEDMPSVAVVNMEGKIIASLPLSSGDEFGPREWRVPRHYDGLYRIQPIIDLEGVEHELMTRLIRVREGKLEEY